MDETSFTDELSVKMSEHPALGTCFDVIVNCWTPTVTEGLMLIRILTLELIAAVICSWDGLWSGFLSHMRKC